MSEAKLAPNMPKWMVDHVDKYLFNATIPGLFEAGRLCLPIFVFVLAYHLARPGTLESGAYLRTLKRLASFGALASAPFMALGDLLAGWWPLNVLFTLLVVTATLYRVEQGGPANMASLDWDNPEGPVSIIFAGSLLAGLLATMLRPPKK